MKPVILAGLVAGGISVLVTSGIWVAIYFVAVKKDDTTVAPSTTPILTTPSVPPSTQPPTQLPPASTPSVPPSTQSSTRLPTTSTSSVPPSTQQPTQPPFSPPTQPPTRLPPTSPSSVSPSTQQPTQPPSTSTPTVPPTTQPPTQPPTQPQPQSTLCSSTCEFHYAESIPYNMTFTNGKVMDSTIDHWQRLLTMASQSIDIASYYWSLLPEDVPHADYSAQPGASIFNNLMAAGKRGVAIRIAQNYQEGGYNDTITLQKQNLAQVRTLNFDNWLGGGILHTKFWNVDGKHFYIGSANLDWRSLTQVKELGVVVYNCPCLSMDLSKIFEVYWTMGIPNKQLPGTWPSSLGTSFNAQNPHVVQLNSEQSRVYLSSSPPPFVPKGRENDITAIQLVIKNAKQYINIAVMDYVPATLYQKENKYWADIDDALRHAVYDRFLTVRLLMSKWTHTSRNFFGFLNSLADINKHTPCQSFVNHSCIHPGVMQVKIFEVPVVDNQGQIPYSRVNHNKYMVTDNAAYIGTSNWSGDYFITTGGVGVVIQAADSTQQSTFVKELEDVFTRDWNSPYSKWLDEYDQYGNPLTKTTTHKP